MIPWFGTTASRRAVFMGIEGLASRLLAVVEVIGCHLMATARPFGINCSFGINFLATVGRGRGDRLPYDGNDPSLRCKWFSLRNTCLALLDYFHWMSPFARVFVHMGCVPAFLPKGINSLGVVMIVGPMPLCCQPINAEVVFIKYVHPSVSPIKKLVVGPWVGSIDPPLVCTGRLVPSAGDALLALIGCVVPPVLLL
ncbi:putative rRNA intron-encoded homing endonuclease [Senna tora]|uniref:Putative rRNA intron-encoded homing endonuclease n=1 Tax=Senna tora TaxID=362788 RepID=A0A834SQR1_9FABA|nr:putative rRNA intron-encoded homing endonuclease [Senna tora]